MSRWIVVLRPAVPFATEAQAESVVVLQQERGDPVQVLRTDPLAQLQHHRQVVAVRLLQVLGEEPLLDRGDRYRPGDRTLLLGPLGGAAGDRGQLGDRLVLEELPRSEPQPRRRGGGGRRRARGGASPTPEG